ncbi:pyocin knob domain-containing protein [Escherichia coli]|uniref:pyocin knob domain-containing protein n=2 Tax=Escherichia coli TaxID=562 RepID=UPI0020770E41|nr:pyocin knob domain-containing protein [Escherichia coli]
MSTANTWSSQQTFKGKTAFSAAATFSAGIAGAIEPEDIGDQTVDLNNLTISSDVGAIKYYYCPTIGGGAKITNKPDGVNGNFLLRVESTRKVSASDYANMQTLISNDTKRIYVRFVVGGSWAAWSQVVVSGWGQDVSVKSLSAVALSGSLTGNASTATKLQTARTIGGVSFDGSANIDLPGVNKAGNQSTTGNAATATKLQTARTIGGVSFDGSANIDLPGVNKTGNQSTTGNAATATKLQTARTIGGVSFDGSANINLPGVNIAGNQNTTGNAATATKLQTARTINGVSFDGSKNIELTAADLNLEQTVELAAGALQKNQNGADIPNKDKFTQTIGACRSFHGSISTGAGNWTTAQFIEWLESQWAFNHPYWMCKCSWSYGNNKIITDTGCGLIHLAGCVIEVMGNKGAMTIRVTTPSTSTGGGITNAQFTYINHGDAYAPGWRRDYNTKNLQPAFALGQTGNRVANDKAVGWNWNSGVYDADLKGASTLILHFNMNAGSCPAVQLRVNYKNGGIYYRSARDGYGFEADWSEFYTTTRKPSAGDVGAYTKAESDSRYVRDIRLGTRVVQTMQKGVMYEKSGHAITGLGIVGEVDGDDPAVFRPIQKLINGTWYNVSQV